MEGRADPSLPAASPPPGPRRAPERPFLPLRVTADRWPPIPPGPSHQEQGEPGREKLPTPDGAGGRGSAIPTPPRPGGNSGPDGRLALPERLRGAHRFRHLPGVLGTTDRSSCAAGALRTASNGILSPACPDANPTPPSFGAVPGPGAFVSRTGEEGGAGRRRPDYSRPCPAGGTLCEAASEGERRWWRRLRPTGAKAEEWSIVPEIRCPRNRESPGF